MKRSKINKHFVLIKDKRIFALLGSCPCFKKRSISYIFLQYRKYFFENKAYKLNFFYIESKQKRFKMLNTDRKEYKNVKK